MTKTKLRQLFALKQRVTNVPIEQSPAILWTTDRQLRLTALGGRGVMHLPMAPASLLGRQIATLIRERHPNSDVIRAHRQARRGGTGTFEHRWGASWYRGIVEALRDKEDNIVGCIGAAINVTLHRAHQQQIAEDNERQRSRLSYELSEELAQKLVGVSMQIDLLRQRLAELAPGNALDLAPITSWLRETVQQSCDLAQRFYPAELDRLGFLSALENLVRTHSLLYAIPCTLKAAKEYAGLDNRTGIQLYRLVESATLYVVSTGRSRGVALHLDARPTAWTMSVTSEGDGTKSCESCAADLERRILGQRTELLGGTLRIRPRPRGGAKVICVLPRQDQR